MKGRVVDDTILEPSIEVMVLESSDESVIVISDDEVEDVEESDEDNDRTIVGEVPMVLTQQRPAQPGK